MKEEDEILKKCGSGNPFTVPEGYFEQFTSDLMSRLPEKDPVNFPKYAEVTLFTRMKPLLYLAASFIGLFLIIKCMLQITGYTLTGNGGDMDFPLAEFTDQEIRSLVDNSYLDDYAIYQLVSDAD